MYRTDSGTVVHHPHKGYSSVLWRGCGYCIDCKLRKAQDWAIRITHESLLHEQNSFLTLTYENDQISPNHSLRYSDVSDFIKRLRRRLDRTVYKNSLNFYRIGEYGTNNSRPHYHLALFGFDFTEPLEYKGVRNIRTLTPTNGEHRYYKSTFLTDCWSHGFADVGDLNFATAMYLGKYITKKLSGPFAVGYGDLEPEKASMSKGYKNPKTGVRTSFPIAYRWIEKYYTDVYPHDFVFLNNSKLQPPKFYDRWLEKYKPDLWSIVSEKREVSNMGKIPVWEELYAKKLIRLKKQKSFLRDGCAPNTYVDEALLERMKNAYLNSQPIGDSL